MDQRERMLAGLPYRAWLDGLSALRREAKRKLWEYNRCPPDDGETLERLLRSLLGKAGAEVHIEPPFHCDYGINIEVGDRFFANFNCVILDAGKVVIGSDVLFAPNVSLYTAGHPIHSEPRNQGYEYGIGITIGDSVWLGGNVVVNPGVHIGCGAVVGSGSVVTKDIPANVVAAGNPCRVLRAITEADRAYYFKSRRFDETDF